MPTPQAKPKNTNKAPSENELKKRLGQKANALRLNPPGVYVIDPDFSTNTLELAGYLGLTTALELHELVRIPAVHAALTWWIKSRQNGFGIPEKKDVLWKAQDFFDLLDHDKIQEWVDTRPIPKNAKIMHGLRRGWVAWAQTIKDIFQAAPAIAVDQFAGNVKPLGEPKLGLTPEDWNRGIALLRYTWKKKDIILANKAIPANVAKGPSIQPGHCCNPQKLQQR